MPEPSWRRLLDPILADDPVDRLRLALRACLERDSALVPTVSALELACCDDGLVLRMSDEPALGIVRLGLASPDVRRRCDRHAHERAVRALAIRPDHRVIDLSAGFARDALLFIAAGAAHVRMVERSPVVALLIRTALEIGAASGARGWLTNAGWSVDCGEATHVLAEASLCGQRGYYDPMFELPGRTAKPRNELVLLARLTGGADAASDAEAARVVAVARPRLERLVVKRHHKAPALARPSHTLAGERVRFDVYVGAADAGSATA